MQSESFDAIDQRASTKRADACAHLTLKNLQLVVPFARRSGPSGRHGQFVNVMAPLQAYAQENGLAYWETSAKSNTNVNDVFVDIASRLPQAQTVQPTATGIQLTEQTPSQPRKSGCC